MKTSLVMAVYNGEKYIFEQIESIYLQTRKIDEVIFFDDGSSDLTVKIIKDFIKDRNIDNWTVYCNKHNKGWEKNFFDGIMLAKNDVIFLSDQDDIWHHDKIEKMMNAFETNDNIWVLVCGYNQFNNSGRQFFSYQCDSAKEKIRRLDFTEDYYYTEYPGCSMAFLQSITPYIRDCWSEKTPHDGIIWTLSKLVGKLYVYDEVLFEQRRAGNNASLKIAHDYRYKLNDVYRVKKINSWYRESVFYDEKMEKLLKDIETWTNLRIKLLVNHNPIAWFALFKYKSFYHSNRQYVGDIYYYFEALKNDSRKKVIK